MRCLDGIGDSMDVILCKLHEIVKDRKPWHAAVYGVTKSLTWVRLIWLTDQSDWSTVTKLAKIIMMYIDHVILAEKMKKLRKMTNNGTQGKIDFQKLWIL